MHDLRRDARRFGLLTLLLCLIAFPCATAQALTLEEAIKVGLEANPDIGAAVANREAIEFELRQARGLFKPQVDAEGRAGWQNYESPFLPADGGGDLAAREASVVVQQLLFDGWNRRGEIERQASRVDGASHRVYERSEFIALEITREYLEVGRLLRVIDLPQDNITYHENIVRQLSEGAEQGALTITDRQQAEERIVATQAQIAEARQELNAARIRFFKLVAQHLDSYIDPYVPGTPGSLDDALGLARQNSPLVKIAKADLDAAYAVKKQAQAEFYPKVGVEARGRIGNDLNGVPGELTDAQVQLVVRWNLYRGGIDASNWQEQIRRIDEQRFVLDKAYRDVDEAMRLAWDVREEERERLRYLQEQLRATVQLVESYTEQFKVGERSLLDLLNTQNTRVQAEIAVTTSEFRARFAEYRILAASGTLLQSLNITPPTQSDAYARYQFGVPETPEAETLKRFSPY